MKEKYSYLIHMLRLKLIKYISGYLATAMDVVLMSGELICLYFYIEVSVLIFCGGQR